ncbi:T9SS C-terminal target domain-containing protein [Ancylomarina euxinus]|uniref:T9SS C-terminal target domain-containing protein n=1 Tax=Ancylomarina euxinus TaxID=2283627 RepID=A0A425Y7L8_9BACT|nr:T9SS type A sorting domain-containing protein [Ancylomarina euxinus]MCZ4693573.1 T9SS type A sorting domain-containing protein [Ancylomarina euxinus]MUP13801.1 T9SS type A sorting domain-containing protein [Ancylomarina euxinus]RRG24565.1 T9SS C-terminal target domain-containing protein [Ancylomarina euxinus]
MIKTFTAVILLFLTFTVGAQNINIPDANFKRALVDNTKINTDGDGEISESEAAAFTGMLSVHSRYIYDLTGLEYFVKLTELDCFNNQIRSLDISKNILLTDIDCAKNKLSNLDLSNNTAITKLHCYNNQLSSLDVSNSTVITELYCYNNQLSNLNVKNNTAIKLLSCGNNRLTSLDVSNNTAITGLYCASNQLTSLDLTNNTAITNLWCYNNQLSSLDLTNNAAITKLWLSNNKLTSLDLTKNTAITTLKCSKNEITNLNLTSNKAITFLEYQNNKLTSLDLTKNTAITYLNCSRNQLTSLDLSNNLKLKKLDCYINQLSSLNVSNNLQLEEFNCFDNQIRSLDISKNILLTDIDCAENKLSNLDVSKNTAITRLQCYNNQLSRLDVSNITQLTYLKCDTNKLTSLDLTNNTVITVLVCSNNQLTSLDLSNSAQIKKIYCADNKLSSLDISKNTDLTDLKCTDNMIPFSELQKVKKDYSALNYKTSKRIFSPVAGLENHTIDYSSEVVIDGNETTFKWFSENGEEVNEENIKEENKGIYRFLKVGSYYCKMTNETFPELTLTTNTITIYGNNTIDIPDANFKKALLENKQLNIDGNNEIYESEAIMYEKEIDISNRNISDLTGIGYFKKITKLTCHSNQISQLDLSENSELRELDCSTNLIEVLNLSGNEKLETIDCSINRLGALNLKGFSKLQNVDCSYNQLIYLKLDNPNKMLTSLRFDQNHLPFSELNEIKAINPKLIEIEKLSPNYLSRQADVFGEVNEEVNLEIDYSLEASFDGNETAFTWTKDYGMNQADETSIRTIKPGVFKFLKEGVYHCEMTNASFPDIVVTTSAININKKGQEITFVNAPTISRVNMTLELKAIASSGLKVNYEILSGGAKLIGNTISFYEVGTVTIKAIQPGNDEYEACEKTIEIQVDFATGIEDILDSSAQIYPNPVETEMVIKFASIEERTIRIFDLQGRLKLEKETTSTAERLNLSKFKSGMYLMKVQSVSGSFTYKIIKK